ncbi:copper resistance protein NlpE N-terminal domain-containing protein [Noviluteimonas dokdonensis]|nr:copper resistance protein NlpE N-terminal domain-containing protein [Lysobacter dokdonensis]
MAAPARHSSILLLPLLAAVALAGCRGGDAPSDASTARFESPDAELSWQGVVACADCDGIDTRLRLQRGNGVVAQYELVEAFLDGEGAEYFHEEGRWRRDGRILRLQATSGGERLYAIDGTGNLVVVDRRGDAAGPGHVLTPAGPPGL